MSASFVGFGAKMAKTSFLLVKGCQLARIASIFAAPPEHPP
jgi:hypothetical protein